MTLIEISTFSVSASHNKKFLDQLNNPYFIPKNHATSNTPKSQLINGNN